MLEEKAAELEKIEQLMLEKLSTTYSMHKQKAAQLEKAYNMRVTTNAPISLGEEDGEDSVPLRPTNWNDVIKPSNGSTQKKQAPAKGKA